jgi:hypothetical protein
VKQRLASKKKTKGLSLLAVQGAVAAAARILTAVVLFLSCGAQVGRMGTGAKKRWKGSIRRICMVI